jgi:hypothetical protein
MLIASCQVMDAPPVAGAQQPAEPPVRSDLRLGDPLGYNRFRDNRRSYREILMSYNDTGICGAIRLNAIGRRATARLNRPRGPTSES